MQGGKKRCRKSGVRQFFKISSQLVHIYWDSIYFQSDETVRFLRLFSVTCKKREIY